MTADRRTAKALTHPTRAQILEVLGDGNASPIQIARRSGQPVANVSYHVRVLQQIGCIRLQRTEQRRGALEHIYEMTDRGSSVAAGRQ